jgi:hypothetical protein
MHHSTLPQSSKTVNWPIGAILRRKDDVPKGKCMEERAFLSCGSGSFIKSFEIECAGDVQNLSRGLRPPGLPLLYTILPLGQLCPLICEVSLEKPVKEGFGEFRVVVDMLVEFEVTVDQTPARGPQPSALPLYEGMPGNG